jgi:hypothetical protein
MSSRVELTDTFVFVTTVTTLLCHLRFICKAIPKEPPIMEIAKFTGDYWATAALF